MELCLNSVGDMYGAAWRKAPMNFYNEFFPKVKEEDIEPRRLAKMKDQYELEGPTFQQTGKPVPWEQYMQVEYYSEIDQMQELINNLRKRPFSSRHIVSSWIPSFQPFEELSPEENVILGKGALAHCHAFQQYLVLPPDVEGGKPRLSLLMYQRSLDLMVGGPFNVAQYALLLHMIAQVVDMEPYEFIWTTGDSHIYLNQLESARAHVKREPQPLPKLWINPEVKDLFAFTVDDFRIEGYTAKKEDKIVYPVSK
jgi:thymidylate synthase